MSRLFNHYSKIIKLNYIECSITLNIIKFCCLHLHSQIFSQDDNIHIKIHLHRAIHHMHHPFSYCKRLREKHKLQFIKTRLTAAIVFKILQFYKEVFIHISKMSCIREIMGQKLAQFYYIKAVYIHYSHYRS